MRPILTVMPKVEYLQGGILEEKNATIFISMQVNFENFSHSPHSSLLRFEPANFGTQLLIHKKKSELAIELSQCIENEDI